MPAPPPTHNHIRKMLAKGKAVIVPLLLASAWGTFIVYNATRSAAAGSGDGSGNQIVVLIGGGGLVVVSLLAITASFRMRRSTVSRGASTIDDGETPPAAALAPPDPSAQPAARPYPVDAQTPVAVSRAYVSRLEKELDRVTAGSTGQQAQPTPPPNQPAPPFGSDN